MGVMAVIGLMPTAALFVVVFMRYENKERWKLVIIYAIVLVFCDQLRVRQRDVDPVAADADRAVVPGA